MVWEEFFCNIIAFLERMFNSAHSFFLRHQARTVCLSVVEIHSESCSQENQQQDTNQAGKSLYKK